MKKGLTFVELINLAEYDSTRPEKVYFQDVEYFWDSHYGDYISDGGEFLTNNINFTLLGYKKCIAIYYDVDVLTYFEKSFLENTLMPMGIKNIYKTEEDKDGIRKLICKVNGNDELVTLPYLFGKDYFKGIEEKTWHDVKSLVE